MTYERKKFKWKVTLQSPDGQTIDEPVEAYWSPKYEGIKEAVALAARTKAWFRNKKKVEFKVLGEPKLVTD